MTNPSIFLAYPSQPSILGQTIDEAATSYRQRFGQARIETWREMDIAGRSIAKLVTDKISATDVIVADITYSNFNVTYEIGYAIGKGKRCVLIVNSTINSDRSIFNNVGIFDTLGYQNYDNTENLLLVLRNARNANPIPIDKQQLKESPVYVLLSQHKTDWDTRLISRLKVARIPYRSFDADEQPRLSAFEAINAISSSYGVLIPLLDPNIKEAPIHNLRGAFLAGLADGMGIHRAMIQQGNGPIPIDCRDFCIHATHPNALDSVIHDFAAYVTESIQKISSVKFPKPRAFLQQLDLGSSSAENEIPHLADYYLAVDPFQRALRGESRLVLGRKGAGKSAIFFRLRDEKLRRVRNVVLDLKPDGYKLRKFKDLVLKLLEGGSAEHLVMAFWEYLLLLEIAKKILEMDRDIYSRDSKLCDPYLKLSEAIGSCDYSSEGDFSERMSAAIDSIATEYESKFGTSTGVSLSSPQITEIVYRRDIRRITQLVETYLQHKDELWLLFDNLDKGWATSGVEKEDLLIIRTLLEASRKLERQLQRHGISAHTVVFLRNDVYELLVEDTPDRGKESKVSTDWLDKGLLRELLRKRIIYNGLSPNAPFEDLWRQICVSHIAGEDSAEYLIDRSLMRPRFLLDLVAYCKGHAVSLNHGRIEEDDIKKGLELFSNDLVTGIGLEIRDVFPHGDDVLYAFIASQVRVSEFDACSLLSGCGFSSEQHDQVLWLLLWFGFFGVTTATGEVTYMHSVHYNTSRMKGILRKLKTEGLVYYINPAFWPALGIG